jgi:hypothetical protein
MDEHLSTGQVELLSGAKPFTAGEYDKLGVLSPRRIGTGHGARLWTKSHALGPFDQLVSDLGFNGVVPFWQDFVETDG